MLNYSEIEIARQIEESPYWGRVAYAAACAQCLHPATEKYSQVLGDPVFADIASEVLSDIWRAIERQDRVHLDHERVEALVPDDSSPWSSELAYAQNSIAAVAYVVRFLNSGQTQEAVWAGRQVYDLADFAVESQSASPIILEDSLGVLTSILGFVGSKPGSYIPLRTWCLKTGAEWVMAVI